MTDENTVEKKGFKLTPLNFLLIGSVAAVLLAVLAHFVISPALGEQKAQSELDKITNAQGPVTASNTGLVTFQGQTVENANIDQKALASGGQVTDPAGFIFTNGKASSNRRILDIYVDFSAQTSRDFFLLNSTAIKGMVESGRVELRVHPVPTGNAYTIYSAEALAETFYTDPDKAWDFMIAIFEKSYDLNTDSSEEVLELVVSVVEDLNISEVDAESIKNGTFASWLISVGDDPRLKTGYYPPLIYVDGQLVDSSEINLNDSDEFMKAVLGTD